MIEHLKLRVKHFCVKKIYYKRVEINKGLNMFLALFETFDQFSYSYLEMREFSSFNQILLHLSNVSSAFHDSIKIVYIV